MSDDLSATPKLTAAQQLLLTAIAQKPSPVDPAYQPAKKLLALRLAEWKSGELLGATKAGRALLTILH